MSGRPWTTKEVAWTKEHVGRPYSLQQAAAYLGRTKAALKRKLRREGVFCPVREAVPETVCGRDARYLLGHGTGSRGNEKLREWIAAGWLKVERLPCSGGPLPYVIRLEDLRGFVAAHPECCRRERMPPVWRGKANPFWEAVGQ